MLSKNQIRELRALQRKKERQARKRFVVEGGKAVLELLQSDWPLAGLYATPEFAQQHAGLLAQRNIEPVLCAAESLTAVSSMASNRDVLALVQMPEAQAAPLPTAGEWVLALDGINDPGNLGTLIRIADWYGMDRIVCSPDSVELYNPKVIAASMGSFLRVQVHYQPLESWLDLLPANTQVLGAFLEGESVHALPALSGGVLLLGSEAHGISGGLHARVNRKVTIPAFGGAESLNVGVAAAVICDNLRRTAGFRPLN